MDAIFRGPKVSAFRPSAIAGQNVCGTGINQLNYISNLGKRKMKHLIAEDNEEFCERLKIELLRSDNVNEVITTGSGEETFEIIKQDYKQDWSIKVISLDLVLNDSTFGLDVLKEVRKFSNVPVVILTSDKDPIRQLEAQRLGANGYLVKEIFPSMLLIRQYFENVWDVFLSNSGCYSFEGWTFDTRFNRRLTNPDGAEVKLTPSESALLQIIVEQPGIVVSQDDLIEKLGPVIRADKDPQGAIAKLIFRLRKKIDRDRENPFIMTVLGQGVQFTPLVHHIHKK